MSRASRIGILVSLLYGVAVFTCARYAGEKRAALAFNPQDYTFYHGVYARTFSPTLSPQHNLNPNGLGVLGFHGTEGARSFHQTIHFEPIKYGIAALYRIWLSPASIDFFIALIYFLPLLYGQRIARSDADRSAYALFGLLYAIFPSVPQDVAFDFRPFILLTPFFALLMFSLRERRPPWESAFFMLLLCLTREEGLIFGFFAGSYAWMSMGVRERGTFKSAVAVSAVWALSVAAVAIYYAWTRYDFTIYLYRIAWIEQHPRIALPLIALAGFLAAFSFLILWVRQPSRRPIWMVGAFSLLVAMLGLQFILLLLSDRNATLHPLVDCVRRICDERMHVFWVPLLLLVWMIHDLSSDHARRVIVRAAGIAAVICVSLWVCPVWWTATGRWIRYRSDAVAMRPIWDLRSRIPAESARVLTDYEALQAFADVEHAFTYRRLPWHIAPGTGRYYPANKALILKLMRDRVDMLAAGSVKGRQVLEQLAAEAGVSIQTIDATEHAWTARIHRGVDRPES